MKLLKDLIINGMPAPKLKDWTQVIADIAVSIGVIVAIIAGIIAYNQFKQAERLERRKVAIEAIKQAKGIDFLRAYVRLKTIYYAIEKNGFNENYIIDLYGKPDYRESCNLIVDDINIILSSYDYISMLYFNRLADRKIISSGIYYEDLAFFSKILDTLSEKMKLKVNRDNFDRFFNAYSN